MLRFFGVGDGVLLRFFGTLICHLQMVLLSHLRAVAHPCTNNVYGAERDVPLCSPFMVLSPG